MNRSFALVCAALLLCFSENVVAQVKITCVGNSITQFSGYTSQLQSMLGSGYRVYNEGVSGTTLMKNGDSPYWRTNAFQNVFNEQPDIITIKLGTNDSKTSNWGPHHSEFIADYNALIDTFLTITPRPQIWLVLCSPSFVYTAVINGDTINQDIVPAIKSVAIARGLPYIDCNTPLLNHPELFGDGVHPTSVGADSLAHIFYRSLQGKPLVSLSDTLLTVSYQIGQPHGVQSVNLTAKNFIPSIAHLTGPLTVTGRQPWLSFTVNASQIDSQVITNTVTPTNLSESVQKVYDTVTVHAGNGLVGDLHYRVLVWFREAPILTRVAITPRGSGAFVDSKPLGFSAKAYDQYGVAMQVQPALSWTATGGTISNTGLFTPAGGTTAKIVVSVQGNSSFSDTLPISLLTCGQGLSYDYYERVFVGSVDALAALTPSSRGVTPRISVNPLTTTADSFALRFSGYLMVPATGSYMFFTTSDDGSALYIDGTRVVTNDGSHGPEEKSGIVSLEWGLHQIEVRYFDQAGGQELSVQWQGPGMATAAIPDSLFYHNLGATVIPQKSGVLAEDLFAPTMRATDRGIAITAPANSPWAMTLYTLQGKLLARFSGKGAAIIPSAKGIKGFFIGRLRSGSMESAMPLLCR